MNKFQWILFWFYVWNKYFWSSSSSLKYMRFVCIWISIQEELLWFFSSFSRVIHQSSFIFRKETQRPRMMQNKENENLLHCRILFHIHFFLYRIISFFFSSVHPTYFRDHKALWAMFHKFEHVSVSQLPSLLHTPCPHICYGKFFSVSVGARI